MSALELRGDGVRFVVEAVDDDGEPGVFVEVANEDEGQASLVLMADDVRQVHELLGAWLAEVPA